MNQKTKKDNEVFEFDSNLENSKSSKTIYGVNPLGMRVLVRIPEEESITDGGLYIPESAKESLSESMIVEVIEVASAHDMESDEATNISGVPQGAKVLISKNVGIKVPWDDKLRIVDTKDILAIVEKIDLS